MALLGKNQENQGKNSSKNTTQMHIPIAEIRNGIAVLKDGGLRLVMLCSTINFELKSEEEQNAIVSGYQNFLNSLDFPIQIIIQSRRMDLTKYLKKLQDQIPRAPNDLLKTQIMDYILFIKSLLSVANIMDKKFFIVIPYELPLAKKPGFVEDLRSALSQEQPTINLINFNKYKKELIQRAQIIASGLSGLGLRAIQLDTQELIELFYATYNPDISHYEKLTSLQKISGSPRKKT